MLRKFKSLKAKLLQKKLVLIYGYNNISALPDIKKRLASSIGLERETFNLKVAGSSPALGFSFSFLNLQLSYELRADQSSYLDPSEIA